MKLEQKFFSLPNSIKIFIMLGMTKPVGSDPVQTRPYAAPSDRGIGQVPIAKDTINPEKAPEWDKKIRQFFIRAKEWICNFFVGLWDFILYEILFFIFDREQAKTTEYKNEMKEFVKEVEKSIILYYELDKSKAESQTFLNEKLSEVREKFSELSLFLQTRVKEELTKILKRSDSNKSAEEIIEDDLLHASMVTDKPGNAVKTFVFIDACVQICHNPMRSK